MRAITSSAASSRLRVEIESTIESILGLEARGEEVDRERTELEDARSRSNGGGEGARGQGEETARRRWREDVELTLKRDGTKEPRSGRPSGGRGVRSKPGMGRRGVERAGRGSRGRRWGLAHEGHDDPEAMVYEGETREMAVESASGPRVSVRSVCSSDLALDRRPFARLPAPPLDPTQALHLGSTSQSSASSLEPRQTPEFSISSRAPARQTRAQQDPLPFLRLSRLTSIHGPRQAQEGRPSPGPS